jgi:hypothetical protein
VFAARIPTHSRCDDDTGYHARMRSVMSASNGMQVVLALLVVVTITAA